LLIYQVAQLGGVQPAPAIQIFDSHATRKKET
jgi:hypothetical protein